MLLGDRASETSLLEVKDQMASYSVIHFATHAVIDDMHPENSAFILSQVGLPDPLQAARQGSRVLDGRWTAREILAEWALDADLVVLSGCETALGRAVSGEGYIGFAHAFLQAGARHLVMSLWEVDDRSTSLLMQSFYGRLLEQPGAGGNAAGPGRRITGKRIAAALKEARRDVREFSPDGVHRPYADPWYWAGFILVGASD